MARDVREANRAWEAVLTAHATVMRRFAEEPIWRDHGVSMREYDVLYTLAKYGGSARIGDLREGVLLSQPALSRMIDRLEQRGLTQRVPDPADGRAVLVTLTETGTALQRSVGAAHARSVERELRALTVDEQRQLGALMQKLADPSSRQR